MQRLAFLSACLFSVFTATAQADEALLMRPEVQAFMEQTSRERGVPRDVIEATLRAVNTKPSILKLWIGHRRLGRGINFGQIFSTPL